MGRRRQLRVAELSSPLHNVDRLLQLSGWTQTELAERADIAVAYLNQLLTGRKKNPTLDTLQRIAAAFGLSSAVVIDRRLSDLELRTELSRAALRSAVKAGVVSHPKLGRFVGTDEAPVTVEGWARLARILKIADTRAPRRERPRGRTLRYGEKSPHD